MSYNIIKQNGWYGIENDGNRSFQWSSELSTIRIEGDTSEYNYVVINAGTNVPNRKIIITYEDRSTFEFFTINGWTSYVIPLKNSRNISIGAEIIILANENRKLGIQVSSIELSKTNLITWNINNLKSKWLDIVYVINNSKRSELTFKFKNTEKKFLILSGGSRTLSLELSDSDIDNNNVSFEIIIKSTDNVIIESIVNRANYYDYLGLKSSKYYDDESKKNEKECENVAATLPLSFQWFVNWKCNFQCPYCWQETSKEIYRNAELNKIPWQQWVDIFNKYNPTDVYITGGEPTLYVDLPEFINGLNPNIAIAMTTNAGKTFNLTKWKQIVSPTRVSDIFFSLHPTQWRDITEFYNKVDEYIKFYKSGYCGIEMVASPQNLELVDIDKLKQWCANRRINCRIDNYYPPTSYVSLTEKISNTRNAILHKITNEYNGNVLNSPLDVSRSPHYCPAGWKKINMDYKGDVFTCMSAIDRSKLFGEHSMPHYSPIGNIFDPNFKLRNSPILCWETFRCSQCDSSNVSPAWRLFSSKMNIQLPLPE